MHLTGKATKWHHNYMSTRYGLFPSWTDYIIEISARFSELFDDPLAELVALKQGSDSIITYLDKFETARMRLVLPEAHALSIFLANMNPHLSLHTRQFEVTSIASAAKIASLHESSLSHIPPQKSRAPFNPYQRSHPKNTPPLALTETPNTHKPTFIPATTLITNQENIPTRRCKTDAQKVYVCFVMNLSPQVINSSTNTPKSTLWSVMMLTTPRMTAPPTLSRKLKR